MVIRALTIYLPPERRTIVGARASDGIVLEQYLNTFRLIEITHEVSARTVQIWRQYRRLKLPDAIIYGTAQVYGLTLITRNTRDFDVSMPGLRIPYQL